MLQKSGELRGVALATILFGALVFAYGLASWCLNFWGDYSFFFPAGKMIGGSIIISLGYIHLNLEELRKK